MPEDLWPIDIAISFAYGHKQGLTLLPLKGGFVGTCGLSDPSIASARVTGYYAAKVFQAAMQPQKKPKAKAEKTEDKKDPDEKDKEKEEKEE